MRGLRRVLAVLLAVSVVLPMPALAAAESSSPSIYGDPENGFTLVDETGGETQTDDSWEDEYPYGLLALEYGQLTVTENGPEMVLKVYRLGGTEGKISAALQYMPAVTQNEDGSDNFDSAISADDIEIRVEDPLPAAAYQAWGEDPAPEETDVSVISTQGTDGEGQPCILLSLDLEGEAESYQWYARNRASGDWEEVTLAEGGTLPVGDEELAEYDFRCVFTLDRVDYCTGSYYGEAYEKPEAPELPEAPEDLELNPEPTYTALDLSQGESAYDGILFNVTFAEGEYVKEIRISAKDDALAEMDEFATLTIVGSAGGDVLESMNTLMLRVADDDQAAAESAQVGFVAGRVSFDKSAGTASITVRRTGGTTQAVSVDWSLEADTALPGVDYTDASGTLTFYGAQTEQTIEIELINDQVEDLEEKTFTVRLSNLLGDDGSSISADTCVVGLYNTNTAEDLNLSSTLYDVEAVDVSGGLTEAESAPMQSGTVTGTQVQQGEAGTGTVKWDDSGISLLSWEYNDGNPISFSGGTWGSTERVSQSLTSRGSNSTTETIENMSQLYYRFSTWATGSAEFASGGNRFLYGDEEYAYTYFQVEGGSSTFYGDVEPEFYRSGFLGININLRYRSGFSVSGDLAFGDTYNRLVLGTKKHDRCNADSDITSTATTTLYRRTFDNPFYLTVYTANDENVADVAHYAAENYSNIISDISIPTGGTSGGRLYEGSTVQIQLGNTHLVCTEAYLEDASGTPVTTGTVNGNAITFSNLILDPAGTYTFRVVLERRQDVEIDVTTSTLTDGASTSGSAEAANEAAYDLLLEKNTQNGQITVGYTPTNTLTGTEIGVSEKSVAINDNMFDAGTGVVTIPYTTAAENIQWINFNLTEGDVIVLNGKSYAGNAQIPLDTSNLTTAGLRFYFYEEEFLTVERPMKATIDAVALYFDKDGNGKIDGYFDRTLGTFVTENGDYFVAWVDGDYEETDFQPVVDEDGTVHQYFLRPYYTANAVAITVPQDHSESERMQVMPSFITDVTNNAAYEALTDEQKEYRTIVSGITTIKENKEDNGWTGHSADDHLKYTAAATAYSYVDIPLGGRQGPRPRR